MNRQIDWSDRAKKDAMRLDRKMRERIVDALDALAESAQGDVKQLRGKVPEWRLRVGDWRIRFSYGQDAIEVLRVLPRGKAYRR